MRASWLAVIITFSCFKLAIGQVAIGTNPSSPPTPAANAVLLLVGDGKQGLVIPSGDRNAVSSPTRGMVIYDSNQNQVFFFNGTVWTAVSGSGSQGIQISGNLVSLNSTPGATFPLASTAPTTNGQLLAWNGTAWTTTTAGTIADGNVLTWNGTANRWEPRAGGGGFANPMTTQGDIIVGGASGTPTRLAAGAGFLKGGATPIYTTVTDADVAAGAAIAGSKINPNFGAQNISTSGNVSTNGLTIGTSTWPANAAGVLTNNGTGTLTWAAAPNPTLGGDLTGTAAAATVSRIQGQPVSATVPAAGQVLQFVSGIWTPANLTGGGTVTNVTATAPINVANGSTTPALSLSPLTNTDISATAAIAGTKIDPAFGTQNITTTTGSASIGGGLNVGLANGLQVSNAGNITRINGIATSFPAAQGAANTYLRNDGAGNLSWSTVAGGSDVTAQNGVLTGNGSTITGVASLPVNLGGTGATSLSGLVVGNGTSAFTAITTGTNGQVLTVNAGVPSWQNPTTSGTAGGDLTGTYPNPTIATGAVTSTKIAAGAVGTTNIAASAVDDSKIANVAPGKILQASATSGQVLKWNGSAWAPATDAVGGGGAPTLNPGQIIVGDGSTNSGATMSLDASLNSTNGNVTVQGLQGRPISTAVPATNSVYQFNGTQWAPVVLSGGGTVTNIVTGAGLTGGPITSTGTISIAAGGVTSTELAAGAVGNTNIAANAVNSSQIVDGTITDADISGTAAIAVTKLATGTNGQVLTVNAGVPSWQNASGLTNPMTTAGDLIYGGAGGTPTRLATGTGFLKGGATPSYSTVGLASADVTGVLPIANGGTGAATAPLARTSLGLGTLATLSTVTSAEITDGTITDTDISGTAAIAGSKIVPNFGAQNVVTTGTLTTGTAGAFSVDATGNITKIRNVTTSFPAANAAGVLTNDGTGTLTWAAGSGWGLTGTAGTVDGTNFIGTTDNIPLTIRVNNQRAMRISFTNATSAPNILAGYSGNTITNGVVGSAILSGGFDVQINQVTDNYSVIGGGSLNRAGDNDADPSNAGAATVSGGNLNKATSSFATVGGGYNNQASGNSAVVAGGRNATASGEAAGVLSGEVNVASGFRSAVVGGNANTASGANSFVGGGEFNGATGDYSAVSGGGNNLASGLMSSIPGGRGLFARSFGETAAGLFNTDYTPASTTSFNASDRLFVIGNGTDFSSRSNALTVLKSGNVGIGNVNPTEKLDVTGNIKFSGALMPNNLPGTAGQVLTSAGPGLPPTWSAAGSGWALGGNNGTVDGAIGTGTNYVGTRDNVPLNLIVNNQLAGRIEAASANANTMFGYQSGNVNTGIRNAGFGYQALLNNAAGQRNAAFGYQALTSNTTGNGNTAVGSTALSLNTTGGANAAFGTAALTNNTASNNTAVGNSALTANTTGSNNAAVGTQSLSSTTTGGFNSALGQGSLINNTTGFNNTGIGMNALSTNTTGSSNTAVGYFANVSTNSLTNATAIGANASVTASNTIQLGDAAVTTVNVGTGTTAKLVAGQLQITGGTLGAGRVLTSDASGNATWQAASGGGWSLTGNAGTVDGTNFIGTTDNIPFTIRVNNQRAGRIESATPFATFYGYQAGLNNGAAQNNTAVGYQALSLATSSGNTAFGYQAMQNTNGGQNVAMGDRALQTNTNGSLNTAVGWGALSNPTSTANNTAIGGGAMQQATGGQNVAVGTFSAAFNSTGATNVFVGYQAGYPNAAVSQANTTGSNNTFIGANTGLANSTQRTNSTAIGANAVVNADNSLILGSINGVNGATASTRVGIGTAAPSVTLDIQATDAVNMPDGTTAQRPASPAAGAMRYNTTENVMEYYNGTDWLFVTPKIAILKDIKSIGIAPSYTIGSWTTRDINSIFGDSFVTINSNRFTLPAGRYIIEAFVPSYYSNSCRVRLYDFTNSTDNIGGVGNSYSVSDYSSNVNFSSQISTSLFSIITISSATEFAIQQLIQGPSPGSAFGVANSPNISPVPNEIYTQVKITKLR